MIYAVIDTNVFVSAMITHHADAATVKVYHKMLYGEITPLYNDEILAEYREVLSRPHFKVDMEKIDAILAAVRKLGVDSEQMHCDDAMPDETDRVFYEITLSRENAYLVTGNIRHFPRNPVVVTPAEMLDILNA